MLLAILAYTAAAAAFYTMLVRRAVVCDEPWAATHPAPTTEIIEIYPTVEARKAA